MAKMKLFTTRMHSAIESVRDRGRHQLVRAGSWLYRDQRGQTPTEYLMIVGFMAAIIVLVFVNVYWPEVREAATTWVEKVKTTILGPT
jgi:Flp pilus assembly pilin Flp